MKKKKLYQNQDIPMAELIVESEHMTAWQFLRICAWKEARVPALVSLNEPEKIEFVMDLVLPRLASYKGIDVTASESGINWNTWESDVGWMLNDTGFLKLHGVGYPVSTAVLGYLVPEAFPIIDRLTVGGVFGWDVAKSEPKWHRTPVYRAYAEHLAGLNGQTWDGRNIQERDIELMNIMRPLEKSKGACPLEGVGGLPLPSIG